MKKTNISSFIFVCCIICLNAAGQQKTNRVKFSSINTVGVTHGSNGHSFAFQTTNGIKYSNWNLGLNTGLDFYQLRSIDVMADVRYQFCNKKIRPFIYGAAGTPFTIVKTGYDKADGAHPDYKRTLCAEAGIGCNIMLNKKQAFTFSTGFAYKHIAYTQYLGVTNTFPNVDPWVYVKPDRFDYYFRRIAVRAGFSF